MSNAIVVNTMTGAVSEYSNFAFQSITPTHAGSAGGLFALGGNLDVAAPIVATVTTGKTQWSEQLKKFVTAVYFSLKGSGASSMTVISGSTNYTYPFNVNSTGVTRVKPGQGIRENYIALSYSNDDGTNFLLDQMEVKNTNATSRI